MLKKTAPILLSIIVSGCAILGGLTYTPGVTTQVEVLNAKGPPAYYWEEPNSIKRFFWPTGPAGTSTVMARFDAQQRLLSVEEVLDMPHFGKIQPGMSMNEVLHEIGPPYDGWTTYFKARDELAWEWRYCDSWNTAARFNVLFDGTSKKVRSTLSLTEAQRFSYARGAAPRCGQTFIRTSPAATTLK